MVATAIVDAVPAKAGRAVGEPFVLARIKTAADKETKPGGAQETIRAKVDGRQPTGLRVKESGRGLNHGRGTGRVWEEGKEKRREEKSGERPEAASSSGNITPTKQTAPTTVRSFPLLVWWEGTAPASPPASTCSCRARCGALLRGGSRNERGRAR